jgi:hypothetical protein
MIDEMPASAWSCLTVQTKSASFPLKPARNNCRSQLSSTEKFFVSTPGLGDRHRQVRKKRGRSRANSTAWANVSSTEVE